MEELIRRIPKAELHLHIEGTLEPEMVFELADKHGVSLQHDSVEALHHAYRFSNLQSFLDVYYQGADVLRAESDFHALTFMNVKLLMVRGKDDKVRVFANTCRHRGATVAEGQGNCKALRCPYHAWLYSLDGALIAAPSYEDSEGTALIDEG